MSADEKSPTSKIPRRLTKVIKTPPPCLFALETICSLFRRGAFQDGRFTEIYCEPLADLRIPTAPLTGTRSPPHSRRIPVAAPGSISLSRPRCGGRVLPYRKEIR